MPADNHYCRRRGRTMMTGGVGGEGGRGGGGTVSQKVSWTNEREEWRSLSVARILVE